MTTAREQIARISGRGGRGEVDRLRAQVNRLQRELADLADTLGDALDGDRLVRRAEAVGERTAEEVARRARQAAGAARENPLGTGFAVVVVVGLLALLLSRR